MASFLLIINVSGVWPVLLTLCFASLAHFSPEYYAFIVTSDDEDASCVGHALSSWR